MNAHESTHTGSYLTPRLEHAHVSDAMRVGILSCPADATLRDAARTMTLHHVHMIVVTDPADGLPVACLSDSALLRQLLEPGGVGRTLSQAADHDYETVSTGEPLGVAAAVMRDEGISHLVVRDEHSGRPVGVLSTLDIAGVLAWGEA